PRRAARRGPRAGGPPPSPWPPAPRRSEGCRLRSAPAGRDRSARVGPASCRGSSPWIIPHVPIPHKDAPSAEELYAPIEWRAAGEFEDILYEKGDGIAKVTINRPEVRNAFRPQTLAELRDAFARARDD